MSDSIPTRYIECECRDCACVVRFSWLKDEVDSEWSQMSIETQTNTFACWYKRIWQAIKYVFRRNHTIVWSETLIHVEEAKKLEGLINEYLMSVENARRKKESEALVKK